MTYRFATRGSRRHPASATWSRRMIVAALLIAVPAVSWGVPCEVVDNGTGTVDLPPVGCGYLSPQDVHMIIDGLDPGTTINIGVEHNEFFQITTAPDAGGGLTEDFMSNLVLNMQGTGTLSTFVRTINIQGPCQTTTGPRNLGDPVQTFPNEMVMLQMDLPPGDPDFDLLRVTAGSGFGLPSPGQTTLTRLGPPGSNFNVDSFFDITYQIEFVGAPGGALAGKSGITQGLLRMRAGETFLPPCTVVDNGTGTIDLPPDGCGYLSPSEFHMILDGLPPDTEINIAPEHAFFFNVQTVPGGRLGGEVEQFSSTLTLEMTGSGQLDGFQRLIQVPVQCEVHTGERNPGDDVQTFPNEMVQLQGQIFGDPDFDQLIVRAGSNHGLPPSPGQTTLTRLGPPGSEFQVDSFFDVFYEIDFQGAPGSVLAGLSGTTGGNVQVHAAGPLATDVVGIPAPRRRLITRPNPFNPGTEILFALQAPGQVEIRIYDIAGRQVRELVGNRLEAGPHEVYWDGRDSAGQHLSSGTYVYELRVDGKVLGTEKAVLLK